MRKLVFALTAASSTFISIGYTVRLISNPNDGTWAMLIINLVVLILSIAALTDNS